MAGFAGLVHTDVAEPGREPVERLKYRTVGVRFKGAPIGLDRSEIVVQRHSTFNRPAFKAGTRGA